MHEATWIWFKTKCPPTEPGKIQLSRSEPNCNGSETGRTIKYIRNRANRPKCCLNSVILKEPAQIDTSRPDIRGAMQTGGFGVLGNLNISIERCGLKTGVMAPKCDVCGGSSPNRLQIRLK